MYIVFSAVVNQPETRVNEKLFKSEAVAKGYCDSMNETAELAGVDCIYWYETIPSR
jgi:hypothetical protein